MHPLRLKQAKREYVVALILSAFLALLLIAATIAALVDDPSADSEGKMGVVVVVTGALLVLGLVLWFKWLGLQRVVPDHAAPPPVPIAVRVNNSVTAVKSLFILLTALAVFVVGLAAVAFVLFGLIGLLVFGIRQIF